MRHTCHHLHDLHSTVSTGDDMYRYMLSLCEHIKHIYLSTTAMHHGSVVSLRFEVLRSSFEEKWPPRGEHFASRYGFSILADFCPARETFNILHRTGRSLTTFSGKDEVIAFVTNEKMTHDDRVAKKFWNEIIF